MGHIITLILGIVLFWSLRTFRHSMRLRHIPTAGRPSLPILSYIGAFRGLISDEKLIEEGYAKYKGRLFKIATLSGWSVIVSGQRLVEELGRARVDEMSFHEAIDQVIQLKHTLGQHPTDAYHTNVIRKHLKNNLDSVFPDMYDEISMAFADNVAVEPEWRAYCAFELAKEVVTRTYGRISVGLPLCRDKDYVALNKNLTMKVMISGLIIRSFPSELKPLAGALFSVFPSYLRRITRHVGPMIEERLRLLEERGPMWDDKPNDILQWLIESAPCEEKRTPPQLIKHLSRVNNGSIIAPSAAFTMALLHLAAHPQYIEPLREEVDAVLKEHGWTRRALAEMHKLDSFYRETQRIVSFGNTLVFRVAMKDYTFSDGTFVPKGTFIAVASHATHMDESICPRANEFDPFRFSRMRAEDAGASGDMAPKYTMVSLGANNVTFGYGKYACPGRFWAAMKLKAMMAYVLVTYDIRAESGGVTAPVAFTRDASTLKVQFRRRRE